MRNKILIIIASLYFLFNEGAAGQAGTKLKMYSTLDYPYVDRYKGKHVIIDLFDSRCQVCFKMLPKVNELQQQFKDRVHFVVLGKQDSIIQKLYEKFKKIYNLKLDVHYDSSFFRRNGIGRVPIYIWIDDKGIIKGVTDLLSLTPDNINKFIQGDFSYDPEEHKPIAFDAYRPFLTNGNGGEDTNFLFRSVLSKWQPGMPTSFMSRLTFLPGTSTFQMLNVSRDDLYIFAYLGKSKWGVRDSLYGKAFPKAIVLDDTVNSAGKEKYCYSFTMPRDQADIKVLQRALRNDLETYFGLEVEITTMKAPYWSIQIKPENVKRVQTKGGPRDGFVDHAGMSLRNVPLSLIVRNLEVSRVDEFQYIDDTGLTCNVDIEILADMTSTINERKALQKAGFEVVKAEKEMTVVLLKKPASIVSK